MPNMQMDMSQALGLIRAIKAEFGDGSAEYKLFLDNMKNFGSQT